MMQKYKITGWYGYGVCLDPFTEAVGDPESVEAYLAPDVDARITELEKALRYWMPDETMVPPEHQKAWDEHISLMER